VNAGSLLFLIAIFALMWALLIRPQKAKQRAQQNMLSQIDPGDEILTVGGIYGIVVQEDEDDEDDDLVVEIADGIHVRVARRAVAAVVKPDEEDDLEAAEDDASSSESDDAADDTAIDGLVTVPDDEATVEATQRRLFRRR
jgi:preprotein translocase subunit YajC